MIKHIIFDFDGTLVDSKKIFLSIWNHLAKEHQFKEIHADDIHRIKKMSIKERGSFLHIRMNKVPILLPQVYKLYRESIADIQMFDGIRELLHRLSAKGYKSAIISSNSEDAIRRFLQLNKIDSFSDVLCSNLIFGKDKMIKKYLRANHLHPSEVIYVGDEQRDIVACKKAGVQSIWVGWGYDSLENIELVKPDYKIYKPIDLLDVL